MARIRVPFTSLPADRFPLLVAHADKLTSGDGRQRFVFPIETFLDGLLARSAAPGG
jgi:hypothetical protein